MRICLLARRVRSAGIVFLGMSFFIALEWSIDLQAQEPDSRSSSLQHELDRVRARLDEIRAAGEGEDADRQRRQLVRLLQTFNVELDQRYQAVMEARRTPVQKELSVARREIERLRDAGDVTQANELLQELLVIEQADQTGDYDIAWSDEPELFKIDLKQGSTLPQEYVEGENRTRVGFAEVDVSFAARPIVLVLYGQTPTLWKVNLAPDVRIHAVVLVGREQQLAGVANQLVLRVASSEIPDEKLRELTGRNIAGQLEVETFNGEPIEIGPSNRVWLASYVTPKITSVAERACRARQRIALKQFADLRFEAYFHNWNVAQMRRTVSKGTYTVAGPIADSLRPTDLASRRTVVQTLPHAPGEASKEFSLDQSGTLAVTMLIRNRKIGLTKVPLSRVMQQGASFTAMAYDADRDRLLLSIEHHEQPRTVIFNVVSSEWGDIKPIEYQLFGLTYDTEENVFYAVGRAKATAQSQDLMLISCDAEGNVQSEKKLDVQLAPERITRQLQLIPAEDAMVLILPPTEEKALTEQSQMEHRLFVFDPASGSLRYSGPILPIDVDTGIPDPEPKFVDGNGLIAQMDNKLAMAERHIAIVEETNPQRAAMLQQDLVQIRAVMKGHVTERTQPELHLVGTHEGRAMHVRVTDRSGPVTLAVCSYGAATWTIEADPGVQLIKIIVGGYHEQNVNRSPPGVPVEIHSHDQDREGFHTYDVDSDGHARAVQTLKKYSPLDIATLISDYRLPSETIVVGPENGHWRVQQVINRLDRLIVEANVAERSDTIERLREHRFWAIHRGSMPHDNELQRRTKQRLSVYSIDGPLIGRDQPLEGELAKRNVEIVSVDATNSVAYVRNREKLYSVNQQTGAVQPIAFGRDMPNISWPSGATLDTKRDRLLLTSFGSGGYLFAYDLEMEQWSVLRRPGLTMGGVVYAPDHDALYAIELHMGDGKITALRKYNAHGALLENVSLSKTVRTERMAAQLGLMQVVYFPGHVAILSRPDDQRSEFRRPGEAEAVQPASIAVLRVNDGAVVYEGKLIPYLERKELSDQALNGLLKQIVEQQRPDEQLLWEMASGYERTISFLRNELQLDQKVSPTNDAELDKLVQQLDADTFASRTEAYERLQELGSKNLPELQTALAASNSSEVKRRLEKLIDGWKRGVSQNGQEKWLLVGLEVLARIDTPEAKQLLQEAAKSPLPVVQQRVQQLLDDEVQPQ